MIYGIILTLVLFAAIAAIAMQIALNIQQCKEENPQNVRLIIEIKNKPPKE